jgi:spore germination protein YaaH
MLKKFLHSFAAPHHPQRSGLSWWRVWKIVKLTLSIVTLFVLSAGIALWWFYDIPLTSPVSSLSTFKFLQESQVAPTGNKIVYGYLPYWNLKKVTLQPEVTHLSYFSLTVAGDGSLITRTDEGGEPGYAGLGSDAFLELSNQMKAQKGAMELTLTQFNGDDIAMFLASKPAQERLMASLDDIILAYPINGINIDIELGGSPTPAMRDNLTEFMKNLRAHLDSRYDQVNLSIAMYAGASQNNGLWDVPGIAPYVDYIIVMAYDFHQRSSPQAGPIAPLFGGKEFWDSDINQHLQAFAAQVPRQKLLLGIPFYGYEWNTTSREAQSHTFPDTGSTASISRVGELLARKDELKVEERWNEEALSPYLSYEEDGEIYVIYYENSRSISYKLDYVNQLDLGGIAIWALGYEGDSRELWDVINRKM